MRKFLPLANEVLGKVMFIHMFVILSIEGGGVGGLCMMSLSVWLPGPMFLPGQYLSLVHVPSEGLCPGGLCPGGFCPGDFCPGVLCPEGLCPEGLLSRGSLYLVACSFWGSLPRGARSRGSLSRKSPSRGSLSRGFCPGGFLSRGSLSRGFLSRGSLSRGSLSRGLCQGEPPRHMVKSRQHASYWNAFLFKIYFQVSGNNQYNSGVQLSVATYISIFF